MILQSLYAYYEKLLERHGNSMPRAEYSSADVSFEIHLEADGRVGSVIPYADDKGKSIKHAYLVPKQVKRSGSGINPYFLCDKGEYLFGSAISMREACREGMRKLWQDVLGYTEIRSDEIQGVRSFLEWNEQQLTGQLACIDSQVVPMLQSGGLCVFKFAPTGRFLHDDQHLMEAWERYLAAASGEKSNNKEQMCLITGERTPMNQIARLHPNMKNVIGAQSSGAALVSFNIPSFCSYGRDQSYNAPTSQKAAEGYGYALNKLLADPEHRVRMNDTTVVFWVQSAEEDAQQFLTSLFQEGQDDGGEASPDEDSIRSRVKAAVNRIQQGQRFTDTFADIDIDTQFYVLGISPNAARLSVRFWHTGTLGELGERVWQHYEDLSIDGLKRTPTIRELLREITVGHEWKNIPPNMEGQMLRAILLGFPYSRAIFAQLINRIRSEADDPKKRLYKIGTIRAAMIKAYLIRSARMNGNTCKEGELTMSLNEQSTSIPYHLGRLFACLEKAQADAQGRELNSTIRDRFWGSASATPSTVFPRLLSLSQHHITKDEKWGRVNDQRIEKVMASLPERFPKRLSLEEQGMFALGYYHQRQNFYTGQSN